MRKSPIRHNVHSHKRKNGTPVNNYTRGNGVPIKFADPKRSIILNVPKGKHDIVDYISTLYKNFYNSQDSEEKTKIKNQLIELLNSGTLTKEVERELNKTIYNMQLWNDEKKQIYLRKDLEKAVDEVAKNHGIKIKIVGGLSKKGYTENDIDILTDDKISEDEAWKIAMELKKKTKMSVDFYSPIGEKEVQELRDGWEDPFYGWQQIDENYTPDYRILQLSKYGWHTGHMSKKEINRFDRRLHGFANRKALRRRIEGEVNRRGRLVGLNLSDEEASKIYQQLKMEKKVDENRLANSLHTTEDRLNKYVSPLKKKITNEEVKKDIQRRIKEKVMPLTPQTYEDYYEEMEW